MIIRHYQRLPSPTEAVQLLQEGQTLHLVGPRQEAVYSLLFGPILSAVISLAVGVMMLLWRQPEEPWLFLLGPSSGVLASLVWLFYSLHLLKTAHVETGIHCTRERLMTFALRRGTPYHEFAWARCQGFLVREESLLTKVGRISLRDGYLDDAFRDEEGVFLNLPSSVSDVTALAAFLEALRITLGASMPNAAQPSDAHE
jgi:hypothetical protein